MSDQHDEFPPAKPGPAIGTGEPPADIQRTIAYPPPPAYPETTDFASEPEAAIADEPSEEAPQDEPEAEVDPEPVATTVEDEPAVEEQAADAEEAEEAQDPFGDWPQPESAAVIEDMPESGAAEHDAGEIDVPDGYTVLEGTPSGLRRSVAVVVSRYNGGLTNKMLARAIEALEDAGVAADAVTIMPVPGAFELPLAAMALAKTRRYACVVALGAIVRGETAHFDFVASEAASGLQLAAIETGVPVAFGVLTVDTVEQAEARIDRAADAVHTALEMADVFAQLRASARS
jgi:6,7-dimethyl-8-ribityllumazine synthase